MVPVRVAFCQPFQLALCRTQTFGLRSVVTCIPNHDEIGAASRMLVSAARDHEERCRGRQGVDPRRLGTSDWACDDGCWGTDCSNARRASCYRRRSTCPNRPSGMSRLLLHCWVSNDDPVYNGAQVGPSPDERLKTGGIGCYLTTQHNEPAPRRWSATARWTRRNGA